MLEWIRRRSPRIVNAVCQAPLRDSTLADEAGAKQPRAAGIASNTDRRRGFIELPAWRLVSARGAPQEYAIPLELQQCIVPGKAAAGPSQPPERARSVAIRRPMRIAGR
jgi:hypothetical protein